jgi:hypothetical protein
MDEPMKALIEVRRLAQLVVAAGRFGRLPSGNLTRNRRTPPRIGKGR